MMMIACRQKAVPRLNQCEAVESEIKIYPLPLKLLRISQFVAGARNSGSKWGGDFNDSLVAFHNETSWLVCHNG